MNLEAVINSITEVVRGTFRVDFILEKPVKFQPGQFIRLTLPELKYPDERGKQRIFSIVNSPMEEGLTITTRQTGSGFKKTLAEMDTGAVVEMSSPRGMFTLPSEENRQIIMIAGGIGVTPFMSMIRYALHEHTKQRIILVYSNRSKDSAAYLTELQKLSSKYSNFELIATMTNDDSWKGIKGNVNTDFIKEHIKDYSNHLYMLAGPTAMVEAVKNSLQQVGITKDRIRTEQFTGY